MKSWALRTLLPSVGLLLSPACAGSSPSEPSGNDTDASSDESSAGEDETSSGDPGGDETGTGGPGDDVCADMQFTNRVDEAACPDIQGQGIDVVLADQVEVCRRLMIDLGGISPTAAEFEAECKWRTAEEIIDDLMTRDDYVRLSQRMWADEFRMTNEITFYAYLEELDAMVGDLYRGQLSLDELAMIAATHPGFTGRYDGLDLVSFSFRAFLGRVAMPAERLALIPLWNLWEERPGNDPLHANAPMVVVNTIKCMGDDVGDCHSDFWGDHAVVISAPVPDDTDPYGPNVLGLDQVTAADWFTLRTPGQLITEQPTFYEAYVERALERYLGYDAGSALPLVRQALVDLMVETGGDVLAVDREILTSVLYLMTNLHDEGEVVNEEDWDPAYWHGPVKQIDPEDWLAAAAKLTGVELGSCDHRYPVVQSGSGGYHPHAYPQQPNGQPDYTFRDKARLLGGCPDRVLQFRERRTGLVAALTQATMTEELCALADQDAPIYPQGVVLDPDDKSEEALSDIADEIYSAALVRPIPDGALTALDDGVSGCRDDLECDPQTFSMEICRSVLKSADFIYY